MPPTSNICVHSRVGGWTCCHPTIEQEFSGGDDQPREQISGRDDQPREQDLLPSLAQAASPAMPRPSASHNPIWNGRASHSHHLHPDPQARSERQKWDKIMAINAITIPAFLKMTPGRVGRYYGPPPSSPRPHWESPLPPPS